MALGQGYVVEVISTELLFVDVTKQLVALNELVAADRAVELLPRFSSVVAVSRRLRQRLRAVWSDCWIKAPPKQHKPRAHKKSKRDHTSVYRLLNAHRQPKRKATDP